MALIPLTSPRAKVIEFRSEPGGRAFGRLLALISAGLAAYQLALHPLSGWRGDAALTGAIVILVAALILCLWDARLTLDFTGGTFRFTRGMWTLGPAADGPLTAIEGISIATRKGTNLYGEPELIHVMKLRLPKVDLEIAGEWPLESEDSPAEILANRIGCPLVHDTSRTSEEAPHRRLELLFRFAAWGGMGFVALLMLFPILSGSRPLRAQGPTFRPTPMARAQQNYNAGDGFLQRGDFKRSEMALEQSLRDAPNNAMTYNQLAYAIAEQGRTSEALRIAEKALSLAPENGLIIDTVAEMHQRLKQFDMAATLYEQALRFMGPGQAGETHGKYGLTLIELGRRQEGINHLRTSAAIRHPRWTRRARQALQDLAAGRKPVVSLSPLP